MSNQLKTAPIISKCIKNQVKSILTKSLLNIREACTSLSIDEFILSAIESLMKIEREEYL